MNTIFLLILKILTILSIVNLFLIILKIILSGFKKNYTYILSSIIIAFILIASIQKINKNSFKKDENEFSNSSQIINQTESIIKSEKKLNSNLRLIQEVIKKNKIEIDSINTDKCFESVVKKNENITSILSPYNINNSNIFKLDSYLKKNNIFNLNKIKQGDKYAIIFSEKKDKPSLMAYNINNESYLLIDFNDFTKTKIEKRSYEIINKNLSGIIREHLWQAIGDNIKEINEIDALIVAIAQKIYPWTIDFYRLNPNDKFKIIYDAKYINNEFIKINKVYAAVFQHNNENFYAIPFKDNTSLKSVEYFDKKGKNLRNFFLRAPVEFKRISSRYSKSRRHPVTGRVKAHKGTDFAAKSGSPIVSTADGIITAAKYKKYNGYYVKIKHNNTYETQYLHMQKRSVNYWKKNGIKTGKRIKQGEIIGYVGQTGLATGPHVCYRFWKNGKQVDPFKQNLPPSKPISKKNKNSFEIEKNLWVSKLDSIQYKN